MLNDSTRYIVEPLCAPLVISPRLSNYARIQSPLEVGDESVVGVYRADKTTGRAEDSTFLIPFFSFLFSSLSLSLFFFINDTRFVIYSTP